MTEPKKPTEEKPDLAVMSTAAPLTQTSPVVPTPVSDAGVLTQGRVFEEAIRQTQPLALPGTREAAQASAAVQQGTALPAGLQARTADRMVVQARELQDLVAGANPTGKAAEIVAISDYRALHAGANPGIVNPPEYVATNVEDIRLSPHHASRKDLVFRFRTKDGMLLTKFNGQVKTGSGQYIADSLVDMANTKGYGKVGYVDGRFVNPDGTPRVAPDAFSPVQAKKLQAAKVRLRGIENLDERSERLCSDIRQAQQDGLDPVARERLNHLRDDIAKAYRPKGVATKVAAGVAVSAATAALVSLIVQWASDGKVEVASVGTAAGTAALYGGGTALADAGLYHTATTWGMTPEAAQSFARTGVAAGFCALAIGADAWSEIRMARRGELTVAEAVGGTSAKAALDVLPFALASLGLVGVPILIGAQLGGRWLLGKFREKDRRISAAIEEDFLTVGLMDHRLEQMDQTIAECRQDCDETDRLFNLVMHPQGA